MPGSYTHLPSRVIQQLLVDMGLGEVHTSSNWPVFSSREPQSPDNCITVYDTEGRTGGRTAPDSERDTKEGIQVRVRSTNPKVGQVKMSAIKVTLDASVYQRGVTITEGETVTQYTVHTVIRTSGPVSLGKDAPDGQRNIFTLNAIVSMRQLA